MKNRAIVGGELGMRFDWWLVCNDVERDDDHCLTLRGIFSDAEANDDNPLQLSRGYATTRLVGRPRERAIVTMVLYDASGRALGCSLPTEVTLHASGKRTVNIPLTKVPFPAPGTYGLALVVNDRELTRTDLTIHPPGSPKPEPFEDDD